MITAERLSQIEAEADAATPGPWRRQVSACDHEDDTHTAIKGGGGLLSDCIEREEDATFIANARQNIPDLIAEVRRLQAFCAPTNGVDPAEVIRESDALVGKSVSATMLLPLAVRAPRLAQALIAERAAHANEIEKLKAKATKLEEDLEDARRMYREDTGYDDTSEEPADPCDVCGVRGCDDTCGAPDCVHGLLSSGDDCPSCHKRGASSADKETP